jgi:16S rRNA (adenine1518-N6/adenine1519-N6)-dimethyltransferase
MGTRLPRARKRFGQHFLHDPAVLDRIVSAISPGERDRLVEIGPGRGALTRELLSAPHASLDAIEIDRDLAPRLRQELGTSPAFIVHEQDALEFDFSALAAARGGKLRVLGNLPYNVSTPLLFHLLQSAACIEDMHFMLQREVVQRMAAAPGDDAYGRLTVMLAPWVEVEALFEVGPGAFQPPPRVWSAVVRLTVHDKPTFDVSRNFSSIVAQAFSHRRKTLRNALRDVVSREEIEACGIDSGARPEVLTPRQFNSLAQAIDARIR